MKTPASSIELLEARIAPAALNVAGTVLTYTDLDGDFVKVTFTGATMAPGDILFSTGSVSVGGDTSTPQALASIHLFGKPGAGFTLTATPQAGKGDSHANVFEIDATNTDVGTINVDGDVVTLKAGTGAPGTVGLKSFTAFSMGQNTNATSQTMLKNVGSFTVKTDYGNEALAFTGGVKSIFIGGNLEDLNSFTSLDVTGDVGSLKIGGSVIARTGARTNINVAGSVGTFSIGGSVVGGEVDIASSLPQILVGAVKTFSVGGDLRGGSGDGGGSVTLGSVGTAKIGGSLLGTDNTSVSGVFQVQNDAKNITIGGSILGGDVTSGAVSLNGLLAVEGSIGTLKLGHDLIGGRVLGGSMTLSSMISVGGTVGTMTIGGSVIGDSTFAAYVSVGGGASSVIPTSVAAIKTLNVKGSLLHARLLAGYEFGTDDKNLDSGFGSIAIGGNLAASTITAGSSKGGDLIAGTSDDTSVSVVATIGGVKIGGAFRGLAGSSTLFYIYAPIVNKLTVAKASYNHAQLDLGVHFNAIGNATALSVL